MRNRLTIWTAMFLILGAGAILGGTCLEEEGEGEGFFFFGTDEVEDKPIVSDATSADPQVIVRTAAVATA